MKGSEIEYGILAILFHWSSAAVILISIIIGFSLRFINGPFQSSLMIYHIAAGFLLAFLIVPRIIWKIVDTQPPPPDQISPNRKQLYLLNHIMLYLSVILVLFSGLSILLSTDLLDTIGNNATGNPKQAVVGTFSSIIHRVASYIFIFLILMHIIGVLTYHYRNHPILDRMKL